MGVGICDLGSALSTPDGVSASLCPRPSVESTSLVVVTEFAGDPAVMEGVVHSRYGESCRVVVLKDPLLWRSSEGVLVLGVYPSESVYILTSGRFESEVVVRSAIGLLVAFLKRIRPNVWVSIRRVDVGLRALFQDGRSLESFREVFLKAGDVKRGLEKVPLGVDPVGFVRDRIGKPGFEVFRRVRGSLFWIENGKFVECTVDRLARWLTGRFLFSVPSVRVARSLLLDDYFPHVHGVSYASEVLAQETSEDETEGNLPVADFLRLLAGRTAKEVWPKALFVQYPDSPPAALEEFFGGAFRERDSAGMFLAMKAVVGRRIGGLMLKYVQEDVFIVERAA